MEPIIPIKRSPQLTPLSHEHHDGLLFVWKIRQGLKNGTSLQLLADYLSWYQANHLQQHFNTEEQLLPGLIKMEKLRDQFLNEHSNIRALFETAITVPAQQNFEQVASAVYDHIRFEERVLFPHVEQVTEPALLEQATKNLQPHTCSVDWTNEFWNSIKK